MTIKYFKPINARYIYNGLFVFLLLSVDFNNIANLKEFNSFIYNNLENIDIKFIFVYLVIFYLVGVLVSFAGFIIIEITIENVLKFILSKTGILNIIDIHNELANKIIKNEYHILIFKNLDNYKKLEFFLLKKDKILYDNFMQNKKIIIQTRDLFAIFFLFSIYYFDGFSYWIINNTFFYCYHL